jgi:protoporphyrin/coproporphyrin ferrochelatase
VIGYVLPFLAGKISKQYSAVSLAEGLPLHVHRRALLSEFRKYLPDSTFVESAMCFGRPCIDEKIESLLAHHIEKLIVCPMFPQYCASLTGATVNKVFAELACRDHIVASEFLGDFYNAPFYINALSKLYKQPLADFGADMLLFIYPAFPLEYMQDKDGLGAKALDDDSDMVIDHSNRYCYRSQCLATSKALARSLWIDADTCVSAFMPLFDAKSSIQPEVGSVMTQLQSQGVKRLVLACPSLIFDDLLSVGSVGITLRERWRELSGQDVLILPCINEYSPFAKGLVQWCIGVNGLSV